MKTTLQAYLPIFLLTLLLGEPLTVKAANNPDLSSVFIVNCQSKHHYGLHSYYLYPYQPVFNEHSNALKYMQVLLRKISRIKTFYQGKPDSKQHSFFIPVSFQPQSWVISPSENDFDAAARWATHNYDYACARKILATFTSTNTEKNKGPIILSSSVNILATTTPSELEEPIANQKKPAHIPVLVQNLSNSIPSKATKWLDTFVKSSWRIRHSGLKSLNLIRERLLERLHRHDQTLKEDLKRQQRQNQPLEPGPISHEILSLDPIPAQFSYEQQFPVNAYPRPEENPYKAKITIQIQQK